MKITKNYIRYPDFTIRLEKYEENTSSDCHPEYEIITKTYPIGDFIKWSEEQENKNTGLEPSLETEQEINERYK